MSPDSPETRLAEFKARLEGLEVTVRAFANLPLQVGLLQNDVDNLAKSQDSLRKQFEDSTKALHADLRSLEGAADRREDERRERETIEREQKRIERKQDIRWRIGTLLILIGFAVSILIAIFTTYSA